jgi:hypothetical protein
MKFPPNRPSECIKVSRNAPRPLIHRHLPTHHGATIVRIIAQRGTRRIIRDVDDVLEPGKGDTELSPNIAVRRGLVARATGAAEMRAGAVARGRDVAPVLGGVGVAGAADRGGFGTEMLVDGGRVHRSDCGGGGIEEDEGEGGDRRPHVFCYIYIFRKD